MEFLVSVIRLENNYQVTIYIRSDKQQFQILTSNCDSTTYTECFVFAEEFIQKYTGRS